MITTTYYSGDKIIGVKKFTNIEEAEDQSASDEFINSSDRYVIFDTTTEEEYEYDLPNADDELNRMFDDEESKEGFDWTLCD
jgi:hypothetical protein